MNPQDSELDAAVNSVIDAIKSPLRSQISTADFVIFGISSTKMSEIRHDTRKAIELAVLRAKREELDSIYGWSLEERSPLIFLEERRKGDFAQRAANNLGTNFTVNERIAELDKQIKEIEDEPR